MSKERVRMVLLVPEEVRTALRLESAKTGRDMSDIVADLLREHCRESLAEVRKHRKARQREGE